MYQHIDLSPVALIDTDSMSGKEEFPKEVVGLSKAALEAKIEHWQEKVEAAKREFKHYQRELRHRFLVPDSWGSSSQWERRERGHFN